MTVYRYRAYGLKKGICGEEEGVQIVVVIQSSSSKPKGEHRSEARSGAVAAGTVVYKSIS